MSDIIPTKILAPPWTERIGPNRAKLLMMKTDQGIFSVTELATICSMPRTTLYNRLLIVDGWKREDVLRKKRYERPSEEPRVIDPADIKCLQDDDDEDDDDLGAVKGQRDPVTIKIGSWERRNMKKDMTVEERIEAAEIRRLARKRRDDEYRDHLKHHRAMCR